MDTAVMERDTSSEVVEKEQAQENNVSAKKMNLREIIPSVDLYESEDEFTIYMDVPGVKQEDLSIDLERNVLSIKGEFGVGAEEGEAKGYREFPAHGRYVRSFQIKAEIDREHIQATLKDGVLKLELPRVAPVTKKIEIAAG